jgi:hypothetical protein
MVSTPLVLLSHLRLLRSKIWGSFVQPFLLEGKTLNITSPSLAQIPSTRQVPVSQLIENEAHFGGLLRDPGVK